MNNFFYYFFRGRWIKATISLFQNSDKLELQQWLDREPVLVNVRIKPYKTEKAVKKEFIALSKGLSIHPLGIELWNSDSEVTMTLGRVLEFYTGSPGGYLMRLASTKDIGVLEQHGEVVPFKSCLGLTKPRPWSVSHETAEGVLRGVLEKAWMEMSRKKGDMPSKCHNCNEDLHLDSEDDCQYCGVNHDMSDRSDDLYKLYKEITAYEQSSDRQLLPRVKK